MSGASPFAGRSVLVTGACGTIGAKLAERLVEAGASRVVCLDNNESELFFLDQRLAPSGRAECYIADLRDASALTQRFAGVEIVLHSAALKHVGLCESSPVQAVRTNIDGTQNVIDAARANGVERVIFTSSDKAVNPTNVMGTTKLMGERLITAASQTGGAGQPIFASTRFGNVLGSRGSVVPLFMRQIAAGGPVTVTDTAMTRFIMTLEEATSLVLDSVFLAEGGEVFVTKMPSVRIADIATHMIARLGGGRDIPVTEIGAKPGEKMYEELMNDEEIRRSFEIEDYFIITPAFVRDREAKFPMTVGRDQPDRPYNSSVERKLTLDELAAHFDWDALLAPEAG